MADALAIHAGGSFFFAKNGGYVSGVVVFC